MKEKWRQELKYALTEADSVLMASRLSAFMQRDSHLHGRKEYIVRSLYFDNLYDKENKEANKSYSEVYYSSRSHQDNTYQYCTFCGADRMFLYDRCINCGNN